MSILTHRLLASLAIALPLLFGGCEYPTRNEPAREINNDYGYRLGNLAPAGLGDTLVIVTVSGGGTRATALALSVLRGMDAVQLDGGRTTLARNVDVISSVSGGSVAAAYFALKGTDGFDALERDFIRQDGMTPLIFGALNPLGLARFATPGQERIDLLIDYLNQQLFHGVTFQTLQNQKRRPLLVLNAADMVEGIPFAFTQRTMDLLCSDLSQMPLATAVAASAAFPVALSPVTLTNHSPCPQLQGPGWPPSWARNRADGPGARTPWYANPQRTALARVENAYTTSAVPGAAHAKRFIHLLDGGIADNLGVFEPYRMLAMDAGDPSLLQEIQSGRIKKLVFVMINARSFKPSRLDMEQATPGMLDMLLASINAPLDRATTGMAAQLRDLLFNSFRELAMKDTAKQRIFRAFADNTAFVTVDFDAITDVACRRTYHSIPTSWSLEKPQVDGLLAMGGALLRNDPEFKRALSILGRSVPDNLPTVAQACGML